MNILVAGCGKIGADICNKLSIRGHEVSVISESAEDFSKLSPDFNGYTNVGVLIDQDVLKRAGIENCDAVIAVTMNDNTNLMIVQLAKEFFGVKKTFARVNDPKKEEVFSRMGLTTICPTNLTAEAFLSAVCDTEVSENIPVGNHNLIVYRVEAEKAMTAMRVSELQMEDGETIIAIEHADSTVETIFLSNYEIKQGDTLICAKFVD